MPVISILSDWNRRDYYTAMVKAKLLEACPGNSVVDISHEITAFNLMQAAFVLSNSWQSFPQGSVHICFVNSEPDGGAGFLACEYGGHFFLSADNGLFSLMFDPLPEQVRLLHEGAGRSSTFGSLDVFVLAASRIVRGEPLETLGDVATNIRINTPVNPAIDKNKIDGHVMYTDSYGNGITNIRQEQFEQIRAGRGYEILVQSNHNRIARVSTRYSDVQPGDLLAVFNLAGFMEIAINQGNVAQLLNLGTNAQVRIKFTDATNVSNTPPAGRLFE